VIRSESQVTMPSRAICPRIPGRVDWACEGREDKFTGAIHAVWCSPGMAHAGGLGWVLTPRRA
jgi:hypothetical protein